MMSARNAALVGLILLVISAILSLQGASAREIAPGAREAAWGQPLPDSALKDLCGKDALLNFGNGFTNAIVQNTSGSGTQSSTASVFSTSATLNGTGSQTTQFDANTAAKFSVFIGYFKK